MSLLVPFPRHRLACLLACALAAQGALAADFTVTSGTTDTTAKTITNGDTGTVQAGATLTTSGATQAVTVNGTTGTATLNNAGTISQTGTARALRNNTDGVTFVLNNALGASITSLADDVFKGGAARSVIRIDNQGLIFQRGTGTASGQALDLRDYTTSTGNSVINGAPGNTAAIIRADGDDALRPGANMTITNYGTIISNGTVNTKCPDYLGAACTGKASAHDAIDVGGNRGTVINNFGTISGPRHGITADNEITVTNNATGVIIGRNGSGVGSDGTGTVVNHGLISGDYAGAGRAFEHFPGTVTTANNGDGDGVDIDGVANITNFGTIRGTGAGGVDSGNNPNGADGIAAGGGTIINNAGAIIFGGSKGITIDDGAGGPGVAATNITNAGTIEGAGGTAISLSGNLNDTLTNSGIIKGNILMGGGDDTVIINGGTITGNLDGGVGNDTLRFFASGTGAFSYSGNITGFETVQVLGGLVSLTGTLSGSTALTIAQGATLMPRLGFTTGALIVNGTLARADDGSLRTFNVTSYAQGATGAWEVGVRNATQFDRINASGTAVLAGGATLKPLFTADAAYIPHGTAFKVITSGGLTVTPASLAVVSPAGPLSFSARQSGNDLELVANRNAGFYGAQAGLTLNGVAGALDRLGQTAGGTDPIVSLIAALDTITSPTATSDVLRRLGPSSSAIQTHSVVGAGQLFSQTGVNRLEIARGAAADSGVAAGGTAKERNFWIQSVGGIADQAARNGFDGYNANTAGIATGADMALSPGTRAGVQVGYLATNLYMDDRLKGNGSTIKGVHLGLYGSHEAGPWYADGVAGVAFNDYSTRRVVAFPGFAGVAAGDHRGHQTSLVFTGGYRFALGTRWQGRAIGKLTQHDVTTQGYAESGAGIANLAVAGQHASVSRAGAGVGVDYLSESGRASHRFSAKLLWMHDVRNTGAQSTAQFSGGTANGVFSASGLIPARDAVTTQLAWTASAGAQSSLSLAYDGEFRTGYRSHGFSVRWNSRF